MHVLAGASADAAARLQMRGGCDDDDVDDPAQYVEWDGALLRALLPRLALDCRLRACLQRLIHAVNAHVQH